MRVEIDFIVVYIKHRHVLKMFLGAVLPLYFERRKMISTPYTVCKKGNENIQGTAIGVELLQFNGKLVSKVAVLWDELRSPAPSFHDPADLEWLGIPTLDALDPEAMLENAMAAITAQAGITEETEEVEEGNELKVETTSLPVN